MVSRFLIRNSLPSTKRKADATRTLCCYRRPAIFFINSSTMKARCSSNHTMVYIENGTYTAVRRRALHHCMRSLSEAMTLPNRGVLSAASCRTRQMNFRNKLIQFDVTGIIYASFVSNISESLLGTNILLSSLCRKFPVFP